MVPFTLSTFKLPVHYCFCLFFLRSRFRAASFSKVPLMVQGSSGFYVGLLGLGLGAWGVGLWVGVKF